MTIRAGGEIPVLKRDGDLVGWYSQAAVSAALDRVAGWLRGISPAAGSLMITRAYLAEGVPLIGIQARETRRTIYIDPATGSPWLRCGGFLWEEIDVERALAHLES